MTTDLTPEELAGLRERAEKAQAAVDAFDEDAMFNTMADLVEEMPPETVLRLVAMAERAAEAEAAEVTHQTAAAHAIAMQVKEAERAARYRAALEDASAWAKGFAHGDTNLAFLVRDFWQGKYEYWAAALAEPEEAR